MINNNLKYLEGDKNLPLSNPMCKYTNDKVINNEIDDKRFVPFFEINSYNDIVFDSLKFIEFLNNEGYCKLNGSNQFLQVTGSCAKLVTETTIKDYVLDYVSQNFRFRKYMIENTKIFERKFINAVRSINIKTKKDKKGISYKFYSNGWIKVKADQIEGPFSYSKLDGVIWEDQIIKREFVYNKDEEASVFSDFIAKVCNYDAKRIQYMESIIGYALHNYRTPSNTKAIIFNDEEESDSPQGGSGKGLIVQALSQIIKTVSYDGKKFDVNGKFVWEKVDETVGLVHLDDVKKGFNFESLFPVITGGFMNVNRKHKPEISLTIEDSPLIVISTNNLIYGNSASFERRQYNVDLYQYFNAKHTPIDEYGHEFFNEWDVDELSRFDNYMMRCIQLYLKSGIPENTTSNYNRKSCIRSTCKEFVEFMDDNVELYRYPKFNLQEITNHYKDYIGITEIVLPPKKMMSWLKSYCRYNDYEVVVDENVRPRTYGVRPVLDF